LKTNWEKKKKKNKIDNLKKKKMKKNWKKKKKKTIIGHLIKITKYQNNIF